MSAWWRGLEPRARRIITIVVVVVLVVVVVNRCSGEWQCSADGGEQLVHVMSGCDFCDVNRNRQLDWEGPDYFL